MSEVKWETYHSVAHFGDEDKEADKRALEAIEARKAEAGAEAYQKMVIQQQMMFNQWQQQMIMCQGIFLAQSPQPQIPHIPPEGYCIDCGGQTNPNPKHPQGKYHIRCTECFNCHMGY